MMSNIRPYEQSLFATVDLSPVADFGQSVKDAGDAIGVLYKWLKDKKRRRDGMEHLTYDSDARMLSHSAKVAELQQVIDKVEELMAIDL